MQRVKQIPFTRVFRSSKTSVLFIYVYIISISEKPFTQEWKRGERVPRTFLDRIRANEYAPIRSMERFIERSQRVRGVIRARACTDRAKGCSDRTHHVERKRYIYIYKLAFFASIRINKSSRGTNALRAYLYVREIERISTVLPCFPPRALPLRIQTSGKSSEIFINLKERYNIYKIIFYSKIYFIIFSQ